MNEQTDFLAIYRKQVMVIDICSSTAIVDGLKKTDNLRAWRNTLTSLKKRIVSEGFTSAIAVQIYKFIGDGWILLFDPDIEAKRLFQFMLNLCTWFGNHFDSTVEPLFEKPLHKREPIGLMFGIDTGDLIWVRMDTDEYIGRSINVASRLQAETKNVQGGPANTAILSRAAFNLMKVTDDDRSKVTEIALPIRGISEDYHCLVRQILRKDCKEPHEDNVLLFLADAFEADKGQWVPITPGAPEENFPLRQLMARLCADGSVTRQNFSDGPYQFTPEGYKTYLTRIKTLRTLPR